MHRLRINRSSTMSSSSPTVHDIPRRRWNWRARFATKLSTQQPTSSPKHDPPAASPAQATSAEKGERPQSSPAQVLDRPKSDASALADHHSTPSPVGRPRSHSSGGGGGGDDTRVRPSISQPSSTKCEKHDPSEQTPDSSKGAASHSDTPSCEAVAPKPEKQPSCEAVTPKPEKQPSPNPPIPSKQGYTSVSPGGGADYRDRGDTRLSERDRQSLRVYLRLGLKRQSVAFDVYNQELRNAYGTARSKDEINSMIVQVSRYYKDETDKNIEQLNHSAATFIKSLEPQFRAQAMEYWAGLSEKFTNFLSVSVIAAQEADGRSLKLTSKMWAMDKKRAKNISKAYEQAIADIT